MSDFDKVIQEKSERNKINHPEMVVPLRDQIPKKLRKLLVDQDVGKMVADMWMTKHAEIREWLDKQKIYLNQWDDFVANMPDGSFDGASQLHLPTTFIHAKGVHARLMSALFGIEPPFVTKAKKESETSRLPLVEATMKHALMEWANENEGVKEVVSDWVWDFVTTGSGILKTGWERKFTSFTDVDEIAEVLPAEGDESGLPPDIKVTEVEVLRTIKTFEGPTLNVVNLEDFVLIGGEGNVQRAHAVIERSFLTASELWSLSDQKIFDENAVEKVIQSDEDQKGSALGGEIKDDRAMNQGTIGADSTTDLKQYEILEAYLQYDANKDGVNEEIIVWVHTKTKEILRATYLRRTNKYGKRPYSKVDYHRKKGQDYGMGVVEMMFSLSLEDDAMHNQAVDSGTIANMPFGFYRPTSSLDPEIIDLQPGALYPLDNPRDDIHFPQVNGSHTFNLQMSEVIAKQINRLTGLSDLSFGQQSTQGAARTATGTRALIGESNINLDVPLGNLARGWRQALRNLFSTIQQRIPAGYAFSVTGERGDDYWVQIKGRADLEGQFDFDIEENSANSNRQIQQTIAQQINAVTQDPIALQTGIVNQSGIFEAKKNLLLSLGVKDWSKYIQAPEEVRRILTPDEEAQRLIQGIQVPVQISDDHEGFIALIESWRKSDEIRASIDDTTFALLEAQSAEHSRAAQIFQQLEAQARATAQAQSNSSQGIEESEAVPQQTGSPDASQT